MSKRLALAARSRPLRDSDHREIAPVDAGSSAAPAASATTPGCGGDSARDDAPARSRRSTPPPPHRIRRTRVLRRRPRNDQIARPMPPRSFTEGLDLRVTRRHSSTRRARFSDAHATKARALLPGLHLLRLARFYSSASPRAMTKRDPDNTLQPRPWSRPHTGSSATEHARVLHRHPQPRPQLISLPLGLPLLARCKRHGCHGKTANG